MLYGSLIRLRYDADSFSANALVDIYAKLGDIEAAMMVFEKILLCIAANNYSSTHANALVDIYAKLGDIEAAMMVFEKILLPDIVSWNTFIAGMGMIDLGRQINSHLIKVGFDTDVFVCVGLVDMYSKCGLIEDAIRVFNLMPMQDLISWNSIISAYVQNLNDEEAISLFCEMQKEGFNCNQITLSTILKSIASLQLIDASKEIHSYAIKLGLESDVYVTNSLIDAYGKYHYTEDSRKYCAWLLVAFVFGFSTRYGSQDVLISTLHLVALTNCQSSASKFKSIQAEEEALSFVSSDGSLDHP
ncbi:pentatricopeptide repeat-containing protein At4g39530-like [Aristolochia californica]|uniref:pentatricopeptide repeat-containing protein At4g39530-like n=1 Tax=Aristolochia californica TaxID=171875 RepID=UPI0035DB61D3